jgi:hypothetical protein
LPKDDTLELLREGDLWSIKIYNQDGEPIKSEISLILRGEIAVEHAGITSKISYGEPAWPRILVHPSGFKLSFSAGKAKNQIILQRKDPDFSGESAKADAQEINVSVRLARQSFAAQILEELGWPFVDGQ